MAHLWHFEIVAILKWRSFTLQHFQLSAKTNCDKTCDVLIDDIHGKIHEVLIFVAF